MFPLCLTASIGHEQSDVDRIGTAIPIRFHGGLSQFTQTLWANAGSGWIDSQRNREAGARGRHRRRRRPWFSPWVRSIQSLTHTPPRKGDTTRSFSFCLCCCCRSLWPMAGRQLDQFVIDWQTPRWRGKGRGGGGGGERTGNVGSFLYSFGVEAETIVTIEWRIESMSDRQIFFLCLRLFLFKSDTHTHWIRHVC